MESRLGLDILPQPTETTCGPTCLHAVYRYFGDDVDLASVIREVPALATGGTLAVNLGCHALARGYEARIYTYDLQVFDPTWFVGLDVDLAAKLREQASHKRGARLEAATAAYLDFLARGGEIRLEDLTPALIRKHLKRGLPILTGLSATYLYRAMREFGPNDVEDDVRGEPAGHFVVLCGYDRESRGVLIADPVNPNPLFPGRSYMVNVDRLIGAILLGVLTYDAVFLVVRPRARRDAPPATGD